MKKSFTLIELLFVIIIIGILYAVIPFSTKDNSLIRARDQLISHINYTRHLAIKDNKMQYYPIDSSTVEMNRSKYWFKQWWQLRFSYYTKDGEKYYYYEIFSDLAYNSSHNLDGLGNLPNNDISWNETYAKNSLTKEYLVGKNQDNSGDNNYPKTSDDKLNLTLTYDINKIIYTNLGAYPRLIFDNYGTIYIREGDKGDAGDINPYDINERKPLLNIGKITLCKDTNCEINISICITPKIGTAYPCK